MLLDDIIYRNILRHIRFAVRQCGISCPHIPATTWGDDNICVCIIFLLSFTFMLP